jgi:hypothetical protein
VSYYKRTHDANLVYWENYKQFYNIAEEQVAYASDVESDKSELEVIDRKIDLLLEQRKKLILK